jgi:disulfide bond formation protein DsbB
MEKKANTILIFILALLSFSLIGAYIIEYGLGHKPCNLCIYQRLPYFLSILLVLNILITNRYAKPSLFLLALISLCGSALAFYHFGIEQGFFDESFVCETQNLSNNLSKEEILKQLKENTVSCKDVNFRIFGLSLASINTIFSFALFIIFVKLYKNYETN